MKKIITILILILTISCNETANNETNNKTTHETIVDSPTPIYNNVWGTIYHAEESQCDDSPNITGDGSYINTTNASNLRWIAISHEMLDCDYRESLINDPKSSLYKGKIEYGDTIWVISPNETLNGMWIVHDTKHYRYKNSIDFLQTKGDGTLYNNNQLWCGRFDSIEIYAIEDARLLDFNTVI